MARYTCPSCGSSYNGRKCRSCFYENFAEEITHGSHVHKGEPLVIDAPVRRPVKRKNPFGYEKKTRKKHPFVGFLALLLLINSLLPLLRDWGLELEARENSLIAPEPEYFHIPEDAAVLYQDEEIQVLARWQDGKNFVWDFPVYVRNGSDRDIAVTARDIQINGYMMEYTSLWCEASAGTPGMGIFVFSEQDKVNAGILAVRDISFRLDIYDAEDFDPIAQSPVIHLTADLPEGTPLLQEQEGTLLFDREGLRVSYLGYSYAVNAYDPYAFEDGALLFLFENNTGKDVEVSLMNGCVNGTLTKLGSWCFLPAGAKAVTGAETYVLEKLDITQPEQIWELSFTMDVWESSTYEDLIHAEPLLIEQPHQTALQS